MPPGLPSQRASQALHLWLPQSYSIDPAPRARSAVQRRIDVVDGTPEADFKTIANFKKYSGNSIGVVCEQFIVLCQQLGLFAHAAVEIDCNKFRAVNSSDRNSPTPRSKAEWIRAYVRSLSLQSLLRPIALAFLVENQTRPYGAAQRFVTFQS
jgi:hypothetical protein